MVQPTQQPNDNTARTSLLHPYLLNNEKLSCTHHVWPCMLRAHSKAAMLLQRNHMIWWMPHPCTNAWHHKAPRTSLGSMSLTSLYTCISAASFSVSTCAQSPAKFKNVGAVVFVYLLMRKKTNSVDSMLVKLNNWQYDGTCIATCEIIIPSLVIPYERNSNIGSEVVFISPIATW